VHKVLRIFLFIGLLCSGIACQRTHQHRGANIVNVPLSDEISTLDPANAYDTISASVIYQVYETLYEYHYLKRPYTLQPLLAAGMPIIEDEGKRYIIRIKPGIQYHDDPAFNGEPRFVTAHDFITQIKRVAFIPTRSNGWWLFDDKVVGLNEFRDRAKTLEDLYNLNVPGLRAVDDHTLVIELKRPYPQLIYALSMGFTTPIPIEAVKHYNNLLNERMVGTGPFFLESWMPMSGLKLVRNPTYRTSRYPTEGDRFSHQEGLLRDAGKTLPFVDGVQYHIIKEAQTRWLNFKTRKLDFLVIPKDNFGRAIDEQGQLTRELREQNIQLQVFPTFTYWWLSFNMKDPVIGSNVHLRRAIAHAIDINRYVRMFTNNIGQAANSIYPPGIPGYDPSAQLPYEYNLEKAKEHLALAGFPEGKGLPTIKYDVRGASATNRQQGQFIENELAKVGITVESITNTYPAFLEKARNGQLQMWQDGWALDYRDAENVLQLLYSKNHPPGPNATFYENAEFDALYEQLKLLEDGPEKFEIMKKLEAIVHNDLPWVMQYYTRNYILIHQRLKNYRHSDLIYNNIKYLRLN
jgi:oligopeptide transport system substrate-binding protein